MDEKSIYWIEIADYDLETAKAMLVSKRYLYVGFMCHQAIEKILRQGTQPTKKICSDCSHIKNAKKSLNKQKYYVNG